MTSPIPLCIPSVGEEERELLGMCISDNFVSSVGPFVTEFENEFARVCGADHAVAVSSGTSALHVAMVLSDIGPGDLVAVSDFTFIASANAVSYTGADILLVDSEPSSWNMDTQMLNDHIRKRAALDQPIPKAIEIVHVLGHPADIEPLLGLRDDYGIAIVEDAAEALGATYSGGMIDGSHVGVRAGLGAFSFNGNKIITSGSGGMLVTNDADNAQRARHLTTQAKNAGADYFHDEVGFNYRMSNVTAAVGLAQLRKLDRFLGRKREIAALYDALLDQRIGRPPNLDFADPSFWLYTIQLDRADRSMVVSALADAEIAARSVWPPLRSQAPYTHCETLGGGVGTSIFESALSLPSSVTLSDADVQRVCDVINAALPTG